VATDPPQNSERSRASIRRWRRRLADERAAAALYRDLAARRTGEDRAVLLGLAEAEERHAAHWAHLLGPDEASRRPLGPTLKTRVLGLLARWLGTVFVLALVQRAESHSSYDSDDDATPAMGADERVHEEVVRGLASRGRERVSGSFRAAVFGVNDGLVSNLALVVGVTGAGLEPSSILLTGLAGLLSGALSMAAGEYISVRSQQELLAASTPGRPAGQLADVLDVDANELALVYRARGMPAEEAERRADDVLRRRPGTPEPEIRNDGHDVVGTGPRAAASSFAFFAVGAALPVLPFLLGLEGGAAPLAAAVVVGLALLATGATAGVLSGGPPGLRALRQLAIGLGAAATTYGLGSLFGVAAS
jgi:vacuolar iron transporter family protein